LACGVRDILGARLIDTATHRVIFGIHQQIGRSFPDKVESLVDLVTSPLRRAACHHVERLVSEIEAHREHGTEVLASSMRYYFHIDNGSRYPDERGSVFSTPDEAAAHAFAIARELAQDASWHGCSVFVTDDRKQKITRVRIGR
jgi:hypothetical protein